MMVLSCSALRALGARLLRVALILAVVLGAVVLGPSPAAAVPQSGDPAPGFSGDTIDGDSVSLQGYGGRPLLLVFWDSDAPPCRAEVPALARFYREHGGDSGFLIIANDENAAQVRPYIQDRGYDLPVLLDGDGSVRGSYGIGDFPTQVYVDGQSRVYLALPGHTDSISLAHVLSLMLPPPSGSPFTDIVFSPYKGAIEDLARAGVIGGFPDGAFRPQDTVSRQQFAKMICGALALSVSEADICPFTDVERGGPGQLYPDHYVAVAAANEITQGVAPGEFGPYLDITRAQVITMIASAAERLKPGVIQTPLSSWAGSLPSDDPTHGASIRKAEYSGLLAGIDSGLEDTLDLGSWDVWSPATRGEVAQMLGQLREVPPTATQVRVETMADGAGAVIAAGTLAAGQTLTGYAVTRDGDGAFVANVAASWSLEVTGNVVAGDLVPAADGRSAVFTCHLSGTARMKATVAGLPVGTSGVITVRTTTPDGYAIGDTGPAGGIIFYDKGDDTGGWRYLEAAPAFTEWIAPWGARGTDIPGADGTAIGTGKQNTADIIAVQGSGSTYAAQLCDGLTSGGYNDWFLPSRDELDLVHANLKSKGFGGFQPVNYWSSSEVWADFSWHQCFVAGLQYYGNNKGGTYRVRAARAF